MSRRRPKSFAHWIAGVAGAVITALIIYQLRIHKAEYRSEHFLSGIQRQLHQDLTPEPTVANQLSPDEIEALREAAQRQAEIDRRFAADRERAEAQERLKEEAWSTYFTPTQRCQMPESQRMVQVCQANQDKFRARFEADWAANKRL